MVSKSFTWICISQSFRYIPTYEPWFPWDFNSSQIAELWVSEYYWGFCGRRRFWKMSRLGDVPSLCAFFQRCLFVTHPHSSQRKNAYYIHPPGERDRINFVKYCWLYSSISLRNQSLFPEEHFPSHARKINPLAVYSIRPTISPVTSPLYLYIVGFFCFAIVIIPFFFNVDNGFKSSSLRSVLFQENHFFYLRYSN